ncbi:ribose 5-phosphate isomerase A [Enteropsectra breve]|nr:ribose 5-phosphate isomerase A [Enteropsectra breve]KAI5150937.1 ribose 5-phosphate isomerase A [Enteropsectra breve]
MENIFDKYAHDAKIVGIGTGKTMEKFSTVLTADKTYIPSSTQSELFLAHISKIPLDKFKYKSLKQKSARYSESEMTGIEINDNESLSESKGIMELVEKLNLAGAGPTSPMNVNEIDVYFDSTDYYNARGDLIKGGGGAMTQEKLLAAMTKKIVIIAESSKYTANFEGLYVPVEIIKPSFSYFCCQVKSHNLNYKLRKINGALPFITDLGNMIVDVEYNREFLENCKKITGVVEHGFFENKGQIIIEEMDPSEESD